MEKCEFCSRKVLFGKKDMSNLLGARPVVLAKGDPVKRLDSSSELWQCKLDLNKRRVKLWNRF